MAITHIKFYLTTYNEFYPTTHVKFYLTAHDEFYLTTFDKFYLTDELYIHTTLHYYDKLQCDKKITS